MNLIPMIAKELGVEVGEEFKLRWNGVEQTGIFRFTNYRLESKFKNEDGWNDCSVLTELCNGGITIIKLPFEPKEGEIYWSVAWSESPHLIAVCNLHWHSNDKCYADKYAGNCFRTNREAEAHKYEIYEKLTGRKWEEKCDT